MIDVGGTHFPVLAASVARTQGPVLELGCGDYSTPMLDLMCYGRLLVSLETDQAWFDRYKNMASSYHRIELVKSWSEAKSIDEGEWDVAFVDHAPAERRAAEILRLKDRAKWIVIHDSEDPNGIYKYETVLPQFKYRFDWKRWLPWTSVVSMFEEFKL